jgi:acetyl-CoA synthetase
LGVKKGDRVTLYLPMIPEAAYAMLACARIGAVHSIVFGGFSPDALAQRIKAATPRW